MQSEQALLTFLGQPIAFYPLIYSLEIGENEYTFEDLSVIPSDRQYQLPKELRTLFEQYVGDENERAKIDANTYEPKVRIEKMEADACKQGLRYNRISLTFSQCYYRDFLIEMKLLDQCLPNGKKVREQYMSSDRICPGKSRLPCQCGVGIFIISEDCRLLYSQASANVAVNPNLLNYASSGSMNWDGALTHPFRDVIRECTEELRYGPTLERLRLFSFGLDLERGFYQFSFYERSDLSSEEILSGAYSAEDYSIEFTAIDSVPFTPDSIHALLKESCWDATAKANLLILASKYFGKDRLEQGDPFRTEM